MTVLFFAFSARGLVLVTWCVFFVWAIARCFA